MQKSQQLLLAVVLGLIIGSMGTTLIRDRTPLEGTRRDSSIDRNSMMRGGMGSPMQDRDRMFLTMMVPHHEGAIEMADLALTKSSNAQVKKLAQEIIAAQTQEIAQMQTWSKAWYGNDALRMPMNGMHRSGMAGAMMNEEMMGDLKTLTQSEDFDRDFARQMIAHHNMAILMADMLLADTARPELAQLRDAIITSQGREIKLMRSWLN